MLFGSAPMNPVQKKIADLEKLGWSLAAMADELGVSYNTVQKWKAGDRRPATSKVVLQGLEALGQQNRIPKTRRRRSRDGG